MLIRLFAPVFTPLNGALFHSVQHSMRGANPVRRRPKECAVAAGSETQERRCFLHQSRLPCLSLWIWSARAPLTDTVRNTLEVFIKHDQRARTSDDHQTFSDYASRYVITNKPHRRVRHGGTRHNHTPANHKAAFAPGEEVNAACDGRLMTKARRLRLSACVIALDFRRWTGRQRRSPFKSGGALDNRALRQDVAPRRRHSCCIASETGVQEVATIHFAFPLEEIPRTRMRSLMPGARWLVFVYGATARSRQGRPATAHNGHAGCAAARPGRQQCDTLKPGDRGHILIRIQAAQECKAESARL